ncbi:MAG: TonB-dependent receptor [Cyclobacteriaceae bacterium]|nr:TonB-dependent receptor [Cyclobacteriaceae bacterium]
MKYIVLLLMAVSATAHAQFAEREEATSDTITSYLSEIVISANKIPEERRTIAQQIKIVTPTTIRTLNAQTSGDLLQNTGLVALQKSQQGGGSPIIRGFEASRVLLMIDGVRLNNLIYRAGHLQNVITVDNNMLDRAEVLFGPSSTVYGSDALGGVVHFFTRNPKLSPEKPSFGGNAFFRYGTANQEKTSHIDFNLGGKKFASLTSFTYSYFDDLVMGKQVNPSLGEAFGLRPQYVVRSADNTTDLLVQNGDPYRQIQSGYKQWDLLQKFLYQPSDRVRHLVNFQYSSSTDVPRYDRLTDPGANGLRFAEWYYGPQTRFLSSYNLQMEKLGSFADRLSVTASYQFINESRHDRRFGNNNRNDRVEDVNVMALTLDFAKTIGKNNLRYGFDSQFSTVKSTAVRTDITTGATQPQSTRYPDGNNSMNTAAIYATHTLELSDKWILNDGIRLGISSLSSTFVNKSFYPFPYDNISQAPSYVTGNAGIIYTPTSWKFSLMASAGFRVPNVDDLAKVFDSVPGDAGTTGTLIVPNPDLKPEKTLNADFSVTKFFGDKVRLEGTFFATDFYDAIVVLPSTFNGQSTVIYDSFPANVVSSQNAQHAYILGYSLALRADLSEKFIVSASFNNTKGRVRSTPYETPLDHIPPAFGRVSVQFNHKQFRSELFSNFNAWKPIEEYSNSGEDNAQYAPARGMPSWYTVNLRLGYELGHGFTVQAGVDNLLDLQYRTFASGINAAGRNLFATIRYKF